MNTAKKFAFVVGVTIFWVARSAFAQWVAYGPGPRDRHTAVFDSATNSMIVFGGTDLGTVNYNDVWVAANLLSECTPTCNLQWSFETPAGAAPAPRSGHSAVYDSVNSRMMVFGGAEGFLSPCANDAWVLENANGVGGVPTWIQLNAGGTPPPARTGQVAGYDPATNVMMVFGGSNCTGGYLSDVWVLSHANGLGGTPTWTQLVPQGNVPPARAYAATAYSSSSNSLVIYGGTNGTALADVWVLSGANGTTKTSSWSQASPSGTAPAPRYGTASGYDSTNDRMIINSGYSTKGILGDTWVLTNATGVGGLPTWVQVTTTNTGPQNYFQSGIYDASGNDLVTFAGVSERAPNPTIADDHAFVISDANGISTSTQVGAGTSSRQANR